VDLGEPRAGAGRAATGAAVGKAGGGGLAAGAADGRRTSRSAPTGPSVLAGRVTLRRRVTWRRSLPSFAAGFAGSLAGAAAVSQLDTAALKPLIIVLLCVAAVLVLVPRPTTARTPARPLLTATAIALVVGGYDGFFGPGTGTLLIVGYLWLLGEAADAASANAKVVNFASNLAAVAWFGGHGAIAWSVSLPMAAGQFVGALVGAQIVLTRGGGVVRLAAVAVALALVAKLTWGLVG
jgi:hypothetical protein